MFCSYLKRIFLTSLQGDQRQYLGDTGQPRVFRSGGNIWHFSIQPRYFNNHLKNPKIIIIIHNYRGCIFGLILDNLGI